MAGVIDGWDATKPAGTDYIDASDEMIRANWAAIEVMTGALLQNLEVKNGAAAATQADVSADRIALFDASSPPLCNVARSVNLTADIEAAPGPNGPESATLEASDKWIFIWVIFNPDTDAVASLLSAASDWSSVVKTDISGYTFNRLVGAVYNDGASNFVEFIQRGNRVTYKSGRQILNNGRSDGSWSSVVDISAYAPSIAKRMCGYVDLSHDQKNASYYYEVIFEIAADASGNYPGTVIRQRVRTTTQILDGIIINGHFEQELTAQEFSYKTSEYPGSIQADLYLQSYWIEI